MSALLNSFETSFWQHVFWALLHSIWQAALIAVVLATCLSFLPARRTRLRYALAYGALILIVLSSAMTHGFVSNTTPAYIGKDSAAMLVAAPHGLGHTGPLSDHVSSANDDPGRAVAFFSANRWTEGAKLVAKQWQPVAIVAWLIISCVLLLRDLATVVRAEKLRASAGEAPSSLQLQFENLKARLNCAMPTELRVSNSMTLLSPCVFGVLRATIVIPAAMLTQLTSHEIESVLAHEIAHIRRHDFLFNLLQLAIGSLYFFNPAVHFINRQIRSEREACCDAAAVKAVGSSVVYAQTLSRFAEWIHEKRSDGLPSAAMGFAHSQNGKLLDRVRRILVPEEAPRTFSSAWGFLLVVLATLVVLASTSSGTRAIASYTSALMIQESEVRAAEINEMKKEKLPPGQSEGIAKIVLRVLDDAGVSVDIGSVSIHSQSGPRRRHGYGISTSLKKGKVNHEFEIEAGTVSLLLDVEGFAPALVLKDMELYADKTVEREVQLTRGPSCRLKVLDTEGRPIENVFIRRKIKSSVTSVQGAAAEFKTDGKGEVTVFNLNHELIDRLSVRKQGFVTATVGQLQRDDVINVTLVKKPITRGTIIDHQEKPAVDAKIYECSRGYLDFRYQKPIATVDKDGKFETNQLSPGKHNLAVKLKNERVFFLGVVAGKETLLTLTKPKTLKVRFEGNLELLDPDTLKAQQNYRPSPGGGASVIFDLALEPVAGSDREFLLHGVVPGILRVSQSATALFKSFSIENEPDEIVIDLDAFDVEKRAAKIVFQCDGQRAFPLGTVRLYRQSPTDATWFESELVEINDGEVDVMVSTNQLRVSSEGMAGFSVVGKHGSGQIVDLKDNQFVVDVEPAGAIHGTVTDHEGKPVSTTIKARLEFHDRSRRGHHFGELEVVSKGNGQFVITPVPLGVKAKVRSDDLLLGYWEETELDSDNAVAEVALSLPESGSAKVRVTDSDGNALSQIPVSISLSNVGSHGAYTNDDGNWVFESLRVHGHDYQLKIEPKSGFQVPPPRPVSAGDSFDIVLEKGHRLVGKVVDAKGQPMSEYEVKADCGERFIMADALTNEQGEFLFTRLPDEPVTLQAAHQWKQIKSPVSKAYTPDQDSGIVLTVSPQNR